MYTTNITQHLEAISYGMVFVAFGLCVQAQAELVGISEQSMSNNSAQSGIVINADVRVNTDANGNILCQNINDCELAMRLDGDRSWLTLYDVHGGVNIKNLKVNASTMADNTTSAIEIGDTTGNTKTTITFNNFGANAVAITPDQSGVIGYRVNNPLRTSGISAGKPTGMVDMHLHGKLEMTGGIKLFNCGTCQ